MKTAATGYIYLFTVIIIHILTETVFAAAATSNLIVSADVKSSCRITSVGDINFGAYDPLSESPAYAAGNVVFRCVKGTSYKTYITGNRTMSGVSDSLTFGLYNEAGCETDFPSDHSVSATEASNFNPITKDIYGQINPGQDVGASSYTTTLVIVVEY
ncbi:MAG: spore coat protein U domain-containing protein [Deltaproteobacteria bacterium]|nr:spore coat protein U domain-containing protein [Deltaproteobacteria bacterium]